MTAGPAGRAAPAVELVGITKAYPGVVANDRVDLTVLPGEVHALVGENGAGKSTLMNVLSGLVRPDAGEIRVDGRTVELRSPRDAIDTGIGMVHQHLMLADNLSVLENVILGAEPARAGLLDLAAARRRFGDLAAESGLTVDPSRRVGDLEVGERQRVEILKALFRGARTLVLDEPTSELVPQEIEDLLAVVAGLRVRGHAIVLISHKLDEVLGCADRVTVMRNGRVVTTVTPDVGPDVLASLIIGADLHRSARERPHLADAAALTLDGVGVRSDEGRWAVRRLSLHVRRGEIAGVAGVLGNGQSELVEAVVGLRPVAEGHILIGDDDVTRATTRARRLAGLGYIPGDRTRHGLLEDASVWENAILGHQCEPVLRRGPWLNRRSARARARATVERFDVRTPDVDVPAFALSGGNQHKLVVGRELVEPGQVLVAVHPTREIDVGAQRTVWQELANATRGGLGVLLVSSDLDELVELSDSLYVILRGTLSARLEPSEVTPLLLGAFMTGAAARP